VRKFLASILTVILLAACNLPHSTPDIVPTTASSQNCFFTWDSQSLPGLTTKVQSALNAAGLTGVSANVQAYGENCTDPRTNKPVSFSTLETDFYITVKIANLTDKAAMGNLLEKILVVLDAFPVGQIPGPQPGNIAVTFQAGSDRLNLVFTVPAGKSGRQKGLHGAALIDNLQKK
jgi:hypothetical protein